MSWRWFGNVVLRFWPPFFNHWHFTTTLEFSIFTAIIIWASQVCGTGHCCLSSGNSSTTFFRCHSTCYGDFLSLLSFSSNWSLSTSRGFCRSTFPHRISWYSWLSLTFWLLIINFLSSASQFLLLAFIWWRDTLDTKFRNSDRWAFSFWDSAWCLLWLNLIVIDIVIIQIIVSRLLLLRWLLVRYNLIHCFVLSRILLYMLVMMLRFASQ